MLRALARAYSISLLYHISVGSARLAALNQPQSRLASCTEAIHTRSRNHGFQISINPPSLPLDGKAA